jgi:phosphotransferase system HPr (HPr) family protein
MFVQAAGKFIFGIEVSHGDTSANAKSILAVLNLGAQQGSKIVIKAEGEDAEEAL